MRLISPASASILSAFLIETRSLGADRFHHEIHGARPHRADGGVDATIGSLNDGGVAARAHGGEDGHTVRIGHHKVEKNEGDLARVAGCSAASASAALGGLNRVAEALRRLFENTALGRVVIDDRTQLGMTQTPRYASIYKCGRPGED